jgi:hypothetical protein
MWYRAALVSAVIHISLKALRPTTIYSLPVEHIEHLAKENDALKESISKIRSKFYYFDNLRQEYLDRAPMLDYILPEAKRDYKSLWRSSIARVIANRRESKKKEVPDIK